jgi:hypothetical protein
MSFSDAEIRAVSERDQADATVTDMARDVARMYAELRRGGVSKDVAGQIAGAFAVTVVFPGCGCPPDA